MDEGLKDNEKRLAAPGAASAASEMSCSSRSRTSSTSSIYTCPSVCVRVRVSFGHGRRRGRHRRCPLLLPSSFDMEWAGSAGSRGPVIGRKMARCDTEIES